MEFDQQENLTVLIEAVHHGDKKAKEDLFRALYGEFHRIASALMRGERVDHTLSASALVNEAVVRLINGNAVERAPNRRYLYKAAAITMRRILVDHARARKATENQGKRIPLDNVCELLEAQNVDILQVDEALDALFRLSERQGLVVVMRFYAGLSASKVAQVLDVSLGTVERDWRFARAFLKSELEGALG